MVKSMHENTESEMFTPPYIIVVASSNKQLFVYWNHVEKTWIVYVLLIFYCFQTMVYLIFYVCIKFFNCYTASGMFCFMFDCEMFFQMPPNCMCY